MEQNVGLSLTNTQNKISRDEVSPMGKTWRDHISKKFRVIFSHYLLSVISNILHSCLLVQRYLIAYQAALDLADPMQVSTSSYLVFHFF